MSSSSKDDTAGTKPSLAADKVEPKMDSEHKKDHKEGAKTLQAKMKSPPKPGQDIAAIVKKYTSQQAESLKKDLAAGQEAFANDMKTQFMSLTKMLTDSVTVAKNDKLPPVDFPQIVPAKPAKAPSLLFPDEDEDAYESSKEEDEDDDETLVDGVESRKFRSRMKPADEVVRLWAQARRSTDDYSAEDWKKMPAIPDVKSYTSHPGARSFKAPGVDSEAPALKYKEQKEHEKKVFHVKLDKSYLIF